jgi:hypothetical protein
VSDLKTHEQAAIEVVARRFSLTRKESTDSSGDWLTVDRKQVAFEVATLKPRDTGQGKKAKPGLRFDKVVNGLMERLQGSLREMVPDGMTVVLTVTAPIRLPAKTAAALEDKIQILLRRGSPRRDETGTIHGNRVRIRVLRDQPRRAPKMIGFVHNPDSDPLLLFKMTSELLTLIFARGRRRTNKLRADRWLVITTDATASYLQAFRHICSQLRMETDFKKILVVFDDRRVEVLAE